MIKRNLLFKGAMAIVLFSHLTNQIFSQSQIYRHPGTKPVEKEAVRIWKDWLRRYPPAKTSQELQRVASFPSANLMDKNIYLWKPRKIVRNARGEIFVIDSEWRHILKFDPEGNYKLTVGRKGQGPEEFMNPISLDVTQDFLAISDNSNYRIQFFDFDGRFIKSLKIFKAYKEIAVSTTGIIFGVPIRVHKESLLVDALDSDGRLLYSFAEPVNNKSWQIANFVKIAFNKKGNIFVAFEHLPLIRVYSESGELLSEWKINNEIMSLREKENIKAFESDNPSSGFFSIIYSIKASESGIFVMHNQPRVQILEFSEAGKQMNDYYAIRSHDYSLNDFCVNEEEKTFYFLQNNPECNIEVFRPIRSNIKGGK